MGKAFKPSGKKQESANKGVSSSSADLDQINLWHEPFVHVMLIVVAGFVVYFNTITSPFLFDDITYLVTNPAIKEFSFFTDSDRLFSLGILPDVKNNFLLRPVSYFTYALNYAVHGLDVRGYHLTNLIIHIVNGLLVYLMVSLALHTPAMLTDDEKENSAQAVSHTWFPLFSALFFVCHPLQTQAVTYIIQRFTSLVVLFYLGSLVLYAKSRLARTATSQWVWYVLALLSAVIAMNTKENAFTLPLAIILFELMFFSGHMGRRLVRLIPFLLTMLIIPVRLAQLSSMAKPVEADVLVDSINLVNFSGVSSWHYLITQFGVIATYLRLLVLPIGQNFDYDYHLQTHFFSLGVMLPLFLLLLIMGTGVYLYCRSWGPDRPQTPLYKLAAFGIFWFFLTLSVESSIVPIDDLIFEHRVYLPSVGFFLSALALAAIIYRRLANRFIFTSTMANGLLAVILISLSIAGIVRNSVWQDEVSFWGDITDKSPNKARAHYGLGAALVQQAALENKIDFGTSRNVGREKMEAGIKELRTAIRLRPDYILAHVCLGKTLSDLKQFDEATTELLTAARLNPNSPLPHIFLGESYENRGEFAKARNEYTTAIAADPSHPEAHLRLGKLHAKEGNLPDAIAELEKSYLAYPDETTQKQINDLKAKLMPAGK
ncbi:tetratricopeptide repeat protein [Geotalea toluenoxydans]